MIKINLNCQNLVETEAFPLCISLDLTVKLASAVFPLGYAPNSVKGDSPFGGGCLQAQAPCIPALVLGHGEGQPDPVVVCPQQGGSQHVTRARGILSSGRPKEADYYK